MVKNKNVLAIGAHPDDVEFMCSGTLKLLKDAGYKIHIAIVANGDAGSMVEPPDSITKIRMEEVKNAASLLDARVYPIGEPDLRVFFNNSTLMKVTECIRKVNPFIVFTHPHEDYMTDHEVTSRLVRAGCFAAPIPNYYTYSPYPAPRLEDIPYLFYWSPIEGKDIYGRFVKQSIYIDITSVIDFKVDMLSCHKSQRDWLMEQHHMDMYIDTMRNTAKAYGKVCGFEYAEGFVQHRGNAYPQDNILKKILGDFVKELEENP